MGKEEVSMKLRYLATKVNGFTSSKILACNEEAVVVCFTP
jgi:hypothetical protein